MLRLRTTVGLSLLGLAIGVAGTGWLSTLTTDWRGPPPHAAARPGHRPAAPAMVKAAPIRRGAIARMAAAPAPVRPAPLTAAAAPASPPAPELIPLSTPSDTAMPWQALRGHLDGRAVLHVDVDGEGRVSHASVARSSGDPVLDTYALRSVQRWRFAVPPSRSAGFSGDLPMRFASGDARLAGPP